MKFRSNPRDTELITYSSGFVESIMAGIKYTISNNSYHTSSSLFGEDVTKQDNQPTAISHNPDFICTIKYSNI